MISEKEQKVLLTLIEKGAIPESGIFEITEEHLRNYLDIYHKLFGNTKKGMGNKTNTKFARRLAGRSILNMLFNRGAKFTDTDAGLIYLIENPAYPEHYKVGITINLDKRLSQYQTYDPYRQFKIAKYDFTLNRYLKEKELLKYPDIYNEQGEWVLRTNAKETFEKLITSV
jgi:T5orf172 domain